jgi:Tfp pilus assembly protein PilF
VVARLDRQLVAVSRSAKSLTGSAGGEVEASDLRVLDRLAARHPEFMAAHGDAVRRARAVVHTRRGANLLSAGDARSARHHFATALREAPGYGRAWYLWFRSWAPRMG